MSAIAHLLGYGVPWWLWGLLGLLALAAVVRLFGMRAALWAAAGLAILLADRRGAQRGYAHAQEKGDRDALRSLEQASDARADAGRRDGDALRLRDDDGYRRD